MFLLFQDINQPSHSVSGDNNKPGNPIQRIQKEDENSGVGSRDPGPGIRNHGSQQVGENDIVISITNEDIQSLYGNPGHTLAFNPPSKPKNDQNPSAKQDSKAQVGSGGDKVPLITSNKSYEKHDFFTRQNTSRRHSKTTFGPTTNVPKLDFAKQDEFTVSTIRPSTGSKGPVVTWKTGMEKIKIVLIQIVRISSFTLMSFDYSNYMGKSFGE